MIDDRAQSLRDLARSRIALLHRLRLVANDENVGICLVSEGRTDLGFYGPMVRRVLSRPGRIEPIPCGGKRYVSQLLNDAVAANEPLGRVLFCVDRDLDDYLAGQPQDHPRLFVTRPYSIESYTFDRGAVERIWTDAFHLAPQDPRLAVALASFERLDRVLTRALRPVSAIALLFRKAGADARLNCFEWSDFVRFEGADATVRVGARLKLVRDAWKFTPLREARHSYVTQMRELTWAQRATWRRGKFVLGAFAEWLRRLHEGLVASGVDGLDRPSHCTIGGGDPLGFCVGHMECPGDLERKLRDAFA